MRRKEAGNVGSIKSRTEDAAEGTRLAAVGL
jgi:hypothetical protein